MKSTQQTGFRQKSSSFVVLNKFEKLTSREPTKKKHCDKDQACAHCCQCWLKFKEEYLKRIKYNQSKVTELASQNELLKKCIQKISKQANELNIKLKNLTDLETIRQKLRKELISQLDEQIKMRDMIQKQKITQLTQKLQEALAEVQKLQEQKIIFSEQLDDFKKKYQQKCDECEEIKTTLSQEIKKREKQLQNQKAINIRLSQQMKTFKQKLSRLDEHIRQKQHSINSMKSTIDHSDKLITSQMSKIAQKDSESKKLQLLSAHKSQELQILTQQHSKSIGLLSHQKSKLGELVDCLKDELIEVDRHNTILKFALNDAEFLATQKSISLQSLKYDVSLLKSTL